MDVRALAETTTALLAGGKGLLAMDESNQTCNRRFAALGIAQVEDTRRAYREMIVTTPDLGGSISGAILYDETIHQRLSSGALFAAYLAGIGIIPGIKVDAGAKPLAGHPGETVTEGLDGLRERLAAYAGLGARFAKWRAVIRIDDRLPSDGCLAANAQALARYAALCQEAGLVPIVEPEVLMAGAHTLQRCAEVSEAVLCTVFDHLHAQRISCEGMILKPSMVLPGASCSEQAGIDEVADATLCCLRRAVPAAVPGIAFLSGGQSPHQAAAHLNAMHAHWRPVLPWTVTFSFARAIQQPALEIWRGSAANAPAAQRALLQHAMSSRDARRGEYHPATEAAAS